MSIVSKMADVFSKNRTLLLTDEPTRSNLVDRMEVPAGAMLEMQAKITRYIEEGSIHQRNRFFVKGLNLQLARFGQRITDQLLQLNKKTGPEFEKLAEKTKIDVLGYQKAILEMESFLKKKSILH